MKRVPFTYGADPTGKKTWRSLNEFAETPEFKESLAREFPDGASVLADPVSRRSFVGLMGASLGLAGLAGCRRPAEKILPYNKRPEDLIEGLPQFYATATQFGGTAIGLLVESHEGRPTKIEGNPSHPHSLGAANAFVQATVLELYDPDRGPGGASQKGTAKDASAADDALTARITLAEPKGGKGIAFLTEAHRSPTLAARLAAAKAKWPNARVFRYDPLSRQSEREGSRVAFGKPLDPVYELAEAKVVVALDSDLLLSEGSPIRQARQFASGRRVKMPADEMNRLYSVESRFSITGATADHRLRLSRKDIPAFVFGLAQEVAAIPGITLDVSAVPKATLSPKAAKFAKALAADLAGVRSRGANSAVAAGAAQPAAVHAVVALVNTALGNAGKTVNYVKPFDESSDGPDSIAALADSMRKGEVESLFILGGNPVFDAPAEVDFAGALSKVAFSAHLASTVDETSLATTWHHARTHYLESWSDVATSDGTVSIVQPLISPLFPSRTDAEFIDALMGTWRSGYDIVRAQWAGPFGAAFDLGWRKALNEGVVPNTTIAAEAVVPAPAGLAEAIKALPAAKPGFELTFHPDSHAWDGRFANVGWMQEMPDQMTKQCWGNAALVSSDTANALGVTDGDHVEVGVNGKSIKIPILIAPGQADESIAISIGQGRTTGTVATGMGMVGVSSSPLRSVSGFYGTTGATVTKSGTSEEIARTQEHHTMEGRPLVREANYEEYREHPDFAREMVKINPINLFADEDTPKYPGLKWGMAIDLTSCIGCNACMVACQSENNIPLTGKDGVIKSREMHWIRIDRYFASDNPPQTDREQLKDSSYLDDPQMLVQPVGCQQCENAPCELVCPVAATTHSPEGLNEMAYNRCVGTRYCANNCPYKVRRFNFFAYNRDVPELRKMQFNPDVTVRSRGVMEKCTYCVQRIQEVKIAATRDGRFIVRNGETIPQIHDGDVKAACQQTCPTEAIKFGDLNDPKSEVALAHANVRSYGLLAELNTRPRTEFLARIRNPNKSLEKA